MKLKKTRHATKQLRRRGIKNAGLEVALSYGKAVKVPDRGAVGIEFTRRDYQEFESHVKKILHDARKQIGKRFILNSDNYAIITGYRMSRRIHV